jgi:Caspase domain
MLARSRSICLTLCLTVVILGGAVSAAAQAAREENRIALVIGNSAYRESPLRNPVNDARAMTKTLRDLGFTVLAHENATKRTMETAVIEFGRKLADGGVGLFYYAGHGLQVRGRNFLVPVDAEIDSEAATRIAAVDVDLLLEQMAEARNRVNVVILDACRNNPFERKLRGASRGLAPVDAARGTLVAYATAPGSVAADGEGANGLYTEELLQALRVPGLKVEEVFKRVRVAVTERSKGAQTPWESSSLTGDLVVNGTVNVTTAASPAPPSTTDRLAARPPALAPARFDGTWNVTVQCPPHRDGAGYSMRFLVQIKDGVLAGQHGIAGQPGSLALSGKVEPDGTAHINARGVTGDPKYTLTRLNTGSAYSYRVVDARFEDSRGSGKRVEPRPCDLTFDR